jgi:hypothetical protein
MMSTGSSRRITVSYKATAAHRRQVVRHGFSPSYDHAQLSEHVYKFQVPPSKLPVKVLAHEVMVVFGAVNLGREDKIRWRYRLTVDGVACDLASTKWGLRLYLDGAVGDDDAAEQLADRVLDKLAAAQRVVNKSVLQPQLDSQIHAGNVTITIQYASLRDGYEYFREGVKRASGKPVRVMISIVPGNTLILQYTIPAWYRIR